MALAATILTSNFDNVDRTSYPFASVSPSASSLVVVCTMVAASVTAGTPTVSDALSGGSLTWNVIDQALDGIRSHGLFWAQCGASPGSGVITLNWTGGDATAIGANWFVIQITGHRLSNPIPQFKKAGGDGTSATAPTGTLTNAIGKAANRVFCYVTHRANEATTERTNWTELGDFNGTAPVMGMELQWRNDGTNETTFGASWTTSSRYIMHGFEVAAVDPDLAGQSDGGSTAANAALNIATALNGSSGGGSSDSGVLVELPVALGGSAGGGSTATGTAVETPLALLGTSAGLSTTTADLTVAHSGPALAGQSDGVGGTLPADLTVGPPPSYAWTTAAPKRSAPWVPPRKRPPYSIIYTGP